MTPPADDAAATDGGTDDRVTVSVTIEDGETHITMHGDRDTAVIVRSASGERIYLPPEDFDREAPTDGSAGSNGSGDGLGADSPYQSAPTDSPYQSAGADDAAERPGSDGPYQSAPTDSPYQSAPTDSPYQGSGEVTPSEGLSPTADGYRIRHPEPVTDVRVLR